MRPIDPPVVPLFRPLLRPLFLGTTDEDSLAFVRGSRLPGRRRRHCGMSVFGDRAHHLIERDRALSFHRASFAPAY